MDIDPAVLRRAIDYAAICAPLERIGYEGFVLVVQERNPLKRAAASPMPRQAGMT